MNQENKINMLWQCEQVKKTMLRFGRALDQGDWQAYCSCFTNPLIVDFKRLTGQPRVQLEPTLFTRFVERILSPVRRHHVFTNWDIEIENERATAVVYMTARHWKATDVGASSNAQYGWYDVHFIEEGGVWKIAEIKHDFQWIEGNGSLFDMSDPALLEVMAEVFSPANAAAAATAGDP